jgi:REP element-mobilizing transposase RayT
MTMQKYNPQIHHRRSIRLKGYDYSQAGAYFVTIYVHQRECLLGDVVNGEMRLSRFGKIVYYEWLDLPKHYPHVILDEFCIMPNHVHFVIVLDDDGGDGSSRLSQISLPARRDGSRGLTKTSPIAKALLTETSTPAGRDGSLGLAETSPITSTLLSKTPLPVQETHPNTHPNPRHPLSEVIRAFKSFSAKRINALRKTTYSPFWQKNYYEHIIRNDRAWNAITWYIINNPLNWQLDRDNLQNKLSPPETNEDYIQDIQTLTERF